MIVFRAADSDPAVYQATGQRSKRGTSWSLVQLLCSSRIQVRTRTISQHRGSVLDPGLWSRIQVDARIYAFMLSEEKRSRSARKDLAQLIVQPVDDSSGNAVRKHKPSQDCHKSRRRPRFQPNISNHSNRSNILKAEKKGKCRQKLKRYLGFCC